MLYTVSMNYWLIALVLLQTVALITVISQANLLKSVVNRCKTFFTSQKDDIPSDFAQTCENIAEMMTGKFGASLKGGFAGALGHTKRQENAISEDIVNDMVAGDSPIASYLLDQFPSVKKRLAKNPAAAAGLMSWLNNNGGLAGLMKPGGLAAPGSNGSPSKLDFGKYEQ